MSRRVFLHHPASEQSLAEVLIGRALDAGAVQPVTLTHPDLWLVKGPEAGALPSLGPASGPAQTRAGILGCWLALTGAELRRLDRYMAYQGAHRADLPAGVAADNAQAYYRDSQAEKGKAASLTPWDPDDWTPRHTEIARHAAQEILDLDPDRSPPSDPAGRLNNILVRAAATERAMRSTRTDHSIGPGRETVRTRDHQVTHDGFFQTRTLGLRIPKFEGGASDWMERETFMAADAVTVLPYDPLRDRVLLAEQFRASLYLRGESYPWSIEPLAGRIDPGEQAEAAARREAHEEAGLTLDTLERIGGYYPATGTTTEYIVSYLALADLPDEAAGFGGEQAEGEDIRAFLLSFDQAMALLQQDQTRNAPLMISLFWLATRRDALRAQAAAGQGSRH